MQVIGKNDDRIDCKRLYASRLAESGAQQRHMVHQRRRPSIIERHGEEKCPAREEVAPIEDHLGSLSQIALRFIRATGRKHKFVARMERSAIRENLRTHQNWRLLAVRSRIALRSIRATTAGTAGGFQMTGLVPIPTLKILNQ